MRADRLLSLLLLLQTRGQMTAQALAEELEVSPRTIYRDIDALSAAGVPVYGEPGPDGGYHLLEGYRSGLTGLAANELRALLMLGVPEPLAQLGLAEPLRAALLKLTASLPAHLQGGEAQDRERFVFDAVSWDQALQPVPHLAELHDAVRHDRKVRLVYRTWVDDVTCIVAPYGLVAKAGAWYLVAAGPASVRAYDLHELSAVEVLGEGFSRPEAFDLRAYWQRYCEERRRAGSAFVTTLRIAPQLASALRWYLGRESRRALAEAGPPDAEGWVRVRLAFDSLEAARRQVLSFGGAAEVLEPLALRASVADYARQTVALYDGAGPDAASLAAPHPTRV